MTFIKNHRRQADGYRFNNNDLFAYSLTALIEEYEDYEFFID